MSGVTIYCTYKYSKLAVDNMARYEEILIDQGSDVSIELHLENPDGTPKSLVNYSVAAQMRRTPTASDSDAVNFTTNIRQPETAGIVELFLTNQQTSAILPTKYRYDVTLSYLDSDDVEFVDVIMSGVIKVSPNITRI